MTEPQDASEIIHFFPKNATQVICGTLGEYKDRRLFHIRTYLPIAGSTDEFLPTKKGVSLPVELLPDVAAALKKMLNAISLDQIVGTIEKDEKTEVRVGLQEYKGTHTAFVREFKLNRDDEWIATPRGVSIRVEKLDALVETADALLRAAEDRGWLTSE